MKIICPPACYYDRKLSEKLDAIALIHIYMYPYTELGLSYYYTTSLKHMQFIVCYTDAGSDIYPAGGICHT